MSGALAPMRARLLRRAGVAHRGPVLDLGAGWGIVTEELARRARGPVVALDRDPGAVVELGPRGVLGDAQRLPFEEAQFDLVFCQQVLMWLPDLDRAMAEIRRVLRPGGVLVALEPDYGGMMEHPEGIAIAAVWAAALARAGADPRVGRRLAPAAARAGFDVGCDLLAAPAPADGGRFDLLEGLPLTADERACVESAARAQADLPRGAAFVHLPFVCITAGVRPS